VPTRSRASWLLDRSEPQLGIEEGKSTGDGGGAGGCWCLTARMSIEQSKASLGAAFIAREMSSLSVSGERTDNRLREYGIVEASLTDVWWVGFGVWEG